MSDRSDSASAIPWPNIVTSVILILGIVMAIPLLTSSRPAGQSGPIVDSFDDQDVQARLWQDPIGTVHEWAENSTKKGVPDPHEADRDGKAMFERHLANNKLEHRDLLVLPVMVSGGPYADYVEVRLRWRQAVLHGLGVCGFAPEDGEHIGYFRLDWPPAITATDSTQPLSPYSLRLLIPYEWCQPMPNRPLGTQPRQILVLWLRDEAFQPKPLAKLASLLSSIEVGQCSVRMLGPMTSQGLLGMAKEAQALDSVVKKALSLTTIYAATPTAWDEILMLDLDDSTDPSRNEKTVTTLMNDALGKDHFHRTIATDDQVIQVLIDELHLRDVHPDRDHRDHIAIIAEWDTFYGRALPLTFAAKVSDVPLPRLAQASSTTDPSRSSDWPPWIHRYTYLRGVDGRLPNMADQESRGAADKGGQDQQPLRAREQPEGRHQKDYLRRLAEELERLDARLKSDQKEGLVSNPIRQKGLRAVGVLGSDIYDKLLVLRDLRSRRLPGVLYFTNDFDARLFHPDERPATHNLIVASAYGLTVDREFDPRFSLFPLRSPPFRDNYQTAMFAATLEALGTRMRDGVRGQVLLYEIGRSGPYLLKCTPGTTQPAPQPAATKPDSAPVAATLPSSAPVTTMQAASAPAGDNSTTDHGAGRTLPDRYPAWWNAPRLFWLGCCVVFSGLLLVWCLWIWRTMLHSLPEAAPSSHPTNRSREPHWAIKCLGGSCFPFAAVLLCGGLFLSLHICQGLADIQEPVRLCEGISIWPSLAIRLFAGLLCIHFLFRACHELHENASRIQTDFHLDKGSKNARLL